jgi:Na+/melibiose symporter-like transporter
MFHVFLFILILLVPLVGGFGAIHLITSRLDRSPQAHLSTPLCIVGEIVFLATPALILGLSQAVSIFLALGLLCVTLFIFLIALAIQRGNHIESFAVTATTVIVLSFPLTCYSHIQSVKSRRQPPQQQQDMEPTAAFVENQTTKELYAASCVTYCNQSNLNECYDAVAERAVSSTACRSHRTIHS